MRVLVEPEDSRAAEALVDAVTELLNDAGFTPTDGIPVLVRAIVRQAQWLSDPNRALDEAVELLNEVTL